MPRKVPLVDEEYYHILNRGVDKREIFMDDVDRFRFLHDLYEFNDKNYVKQSFNRRMADDVTDGHSVAVSKRDMLVEIISFCLMPNHFHFILRQLQENGISTFMHKLGQGYAHYFNKKYERSGALFQGSFKSVHVNSDEQLLHLSRYIHLLNPGELVEPKIRDGIVSDRNKLNEFLKNYKWSSYLDYIGIENYPSLINKDFLMSYFSARGGSASGGKDEKDYENFVMFGLNDKNRLEEDVILE